MKDQELVSILEEKIAEDQDRIELDLSNKPIIQFSEISKALFELKFQNLEMLFLENCDLKSLQNFPVLPILSILNLSDNVFPGKELTALKHLEFLTVLKLNICKNVSISDIFELAIFPNLRKLDIKHMSFQVGSQQRSQIFQRCASLRVLNDFDENEQVIYESSSESFESEDEFNSCNMVFQKSQWENEMEFDDNFKIERIKK